MALEPAQYVLIGGNDLVQLTRERVADLERAHYRVMLEVYEAGMTGDLAERLHDLEHRREVQLSRLVPPGTDEDTPDGGRQSDEGDGGDGVAPPDETNTDGEPPADNAHDGDAVDGDAADPVGPIDPPLDDDDTPPRPRRGRARSRPRRDDEQEGDASP